MSDSAKNSIEKIKTEILRIEEDCIHPARRSFNAGARWTALNSWLGVPSVILSALAGTAFFKDYATVGGGMSAIVAILTSLMTFLKCK